MTVLGALSSRKVHVNWPVKVSRKATRPKLCIEKLTESVLRRSNVPFEETPNRVTNIAELVYKVNVQDMLFMPFPESCTPLRQKRNELGSTLLYLVIPSESKYVLCIQCSTNVCLCLKCRSLPYRYIYG